MPRVLIAGCGYLGQAVAELFIAAGWEVEGWIKSADSAQQLSTKSYPVHAIDISQADQVRAREGNFDAVIHCASTRGGDVDLYRHVYLDGARNLLERFGGSQILFTSSTSIYAQTDGSMVDERSPAEPRHAKGKILRETEELVLAAGGIVARLGGIHGPHRSFFLSRFLEGAALVAQDDRLINQIHRDDIVSALLLLVDRRAGCRGEIFNVVADRPVKANAANEWLSSHLKRPLVLDSGDTGQRKRGDSNKQVSNRKLRALGWEPRYPDFESAMTESILPSFGF